MEVSQGEKSGKDIPSTRNSMCQGQEVRGGRFKEMGVVWYDWSAGGTVGNAWKGRRARYCEEPGKLAGEFGFYSVDRRES